MLEAKVTSLFYEVEKAQDSLKTLERDMNIKKAFSKLKDKHIDDALLKIQKASPEVVEKFKKSDEYSDKQCNYYVDGFELFCKYTAKHHPDLDFSTLDIEAVEKEIRSDRPSTGSAVGNVDDRMEDDDDVVTAEAPVDPSPSNPT